ncbi:MAG: HTH domain-containing protein [Lachnospiraceae bacterium]|nr:HTH domain-containing protein [Lachnospiraceae bacterium]
MKDMQLPLRHRQIIDVLRTKQEYITGNELASLLNTTARTIRKDISQINEALKPTGIQVLSKHRYGYMLDVPNPEALAAITQSTESFLSRPERMRYIAYTLFLHDDFVNLDELADMMYISKTTLELDLKEFRKKYLLIPPYIKLLRRKNAIAFEADERKKRRLLCYLYSEDWDYNGRGNAFFKYTYLTEKDVNICMREISYYMDYYNIKMEDVNVVHLNLRVATMIHRIHDGHVILDEPKETLMIPEAYEMITDLFDHLEGIFDCEIPKTERMDACVFVSESILPDLDKIREMGFPSYFPTALLKLTNDYLDLLKKEYGIDFSADKDFYLTLVLCLQFLGRNNYNLNFTGIQNRTIFIDYAVEFELAISIQPLAQKYFGYYLDFPELFYLMQTLSGALSGMKQKKIRTVLMFHYNLPVCWNFSQHLKDTFGDKIEVIDLLPVYQKANFDFSNIDLLLTSVSKDMTTNKELPIIRVSPYFSVQDQQMIQAFIKQQHTQMLYRKDYPSMYEWLSKATWYESLEEDDYFHALTTLGEHIISSGFATDEFLLHVLNREQLASFACNEPFIIVHGPSGTDQTSVFVATYQHRLRVNGHKIQTIIMLSLADKDKSLVFKFFNELYSGSLNHEDLRFLQKKNDILPMLKDI